ncbi:hypothetical protein E9531_10340 [Lampropedia puyangensis]|uniref:Uncharacterized protein n=1 Tax=Lampropedia puyangensis TaxID=1330072 RepID=A0A4S8F087_9BURK|nr:hypothetical protein [Lampropedia puyangensis]THU00660.1 hypothetical protein E9531_10340 [Lampropedia puyangensis]
MNRTSPIFDYASSTQGQLTTIVLTALALLGGYYLAPYLPPVWGWENGLIENAQVLVLIAGSFWAIREARHSQRQPHRAFWWIICPIWLAMALRELSWGACLLMPLHIDPVTGPTFSSSQQLFYKPFIAPTLAAMLLVQALLALRWRVDKLLPQLWRMRAIPLIEIGIFVVSFLVSTAAEGHMGMHLSGLPEGSDQLLEEWAELWAYLALFAAQARVAMALRIARTPPT